MELKHATDPGKVFDEDLYFITKMMVSKNPPTVCGSLREQCKISTKHRKFLTEGGAFTDDQIDAYIELKFQEISILSEHTPHPIEV